MNTKEPVEDKNFIPTLTHVTKASIQPTSQKKKMSAVQLGLCSCAHTYLCVCVFVCVCASECVCV